MLPETAAAGRVRCSARLGGLGLATVRGIGEFQYEHDLAALATLSVVALTDLVAVVAKPTEMAVVPAPVGLLEKVQLATGFLVPKDGTVAPGHLHVAELAFTGV